ncbi:MAG: hypothetical protein ABR552_07540, partial [Actinomycetota bacterium]
MTAVWMRARAELRARWRALLSAAILAGLFGAAVLATLAGARRTQTAYPTFIDRQRGYDVMVFDSTLFGEVFWKPDFDALARLPYVDTAVPVDNAYIHAGGDLPAGAGILISTDPRFGTTIQRPRLVRGRMPSAANEVAVPFFADRKNADNNTDLGTFGLGDSINLDAHGRPVVLKVVGVTIIPGELPPRPQWGWELLAGPAFETTYIRGCEVGEGPH